MTNAPDNFPWPEHELLGSLLDTPERWQELDWVLTQADFIEPTHWRIYLAIGATHRDGGPADVGDIARRMAEDPGLQELGGCSYLTLLAVKASSREPLDKVIRDLKEAAGALPGRAGAGGRRGKQSDTLIALARAATLFHTSDCTAFADIEVHGHRETWPVRSKEFKLWLTRSFFEATSGAPNSEAMQAALAAIEANARFAGSERAVFTRIGRFRGRIYLDLADETWRAAEIGAGGWRVNCRPPVRFRRAAGMRPLPAPVSGGEIGALRRFLNIRSDAELVLVVSWLLAALCDRGPYPVLLVSGEQGSAKSTFLRFLRDLVDPNTSPLRTLPPDVRGLFIAARNGHVLAFDNVSGIPSWLSDAVCQLATGGGFAARQLYTDEDELLIDVMRPVMVNGIEEVATRPDLLDRAILITLEPIPDNQRRTEAALWEDFNAERPQLLGVLLDAVSRGLRKQPRTRLAKLPRMADFAEWATACETALWPSGTFLKAYAGAMDEAVDTAIEADPVATAVRTLMRRRDKWDGTATELMHELGLLAGPEITKARGWPANAQSLSGRLRRAAPPLRKVGISFTTRQEGHAKTRMIHLFASSTEAECEGE
jgi:hypothetical protein